MLDAVTFKGLNACVVHPSGIMGPKDYAKGLAIVHRIVELSGGRIEVESELGQGSSFIVILQNAEV